MTKVILKAMVEEYQKEWVETMARKKDMSIGEVVRRAIDRAIESKMK